MSVYTFLIKKGHKKYIVAYNAHNYNEAISLLAKDKNNRYSGCEVLAHVISKEDNYE